MAHYEQTDQLFCTKAQNEELIVVYIVGEMT